MECTDYFSLKNFISFNRFELHKFKLAHGIKTARKLASQSQSARAESPALLAQNPHSKRLPARKRPILQFRSIKALNFESI